MNNKEEIEKILNKYGSLKEPFFFMIDFDMKSYEIIPLNKIEDNILYTIDDNFTFNKHDYTISSEIVNYKEYKEKFDNIQKQIIEGNTYLLNLTKKTKITTNHSLKDIYKSANAKFKLYYKDKFICFSPERFVEIKNNNIFTYPMKGTIDAKIPNAKNKILKDEKELAEHTMVVDLLRNDLSIISKNVKVNDFRYIQKIDAGKKKLLQVSSKISGELESNWEEKIGTILTSLLPAGSITGTPKKKTVDIINDIEDYDRGYFTGIFGVYDGKTLDSAVMIRFIQKLESGHLIYKSGGGITCDSDVEKEYQEMIDKVYIP